MKPPLLTSTLKAGLTVSLALHVVAAVGVLKFRHVQAHLPPEHHVTITLFSDVEELVEPELATAPPLPEPPPEPPPASVPEPTLTPTAVVPVSTPVPVPVAVVPAPPAPTPAEAPAPAALIESTTQIAVAIAIAGPVLAPLRPGGDGPALHPDHDAVTRPASPGVRALPLYRKNPEPPYPAAARRRRQEGLVLLQVTVAAAGRATRVEVKQSSSFPLLDEAAVRAVREWEFAPARLDAQAVESEIEVPVRFKLIH